MEEYKIVIAIIIAMENLDIVQLNIHIIKQILILKLTYLHFCL